MKSKILIITAITFALASCGGDKDPAERLEEVKTEIAELEKEKKELMEEIAAADTSKKEKTLVVLGHAEKKTFKRPVKIQGVVESEENVLVSPEVSGKIINLKVNEGDVVRKGQVLAVIDNSVVTNQLQELRTRLELAKTTYERQERLYNDKKIGSEIQYLQAKNNYFALLDQEKALESQVAKFSITAPITGTVDMVYVNEGENAMPGSPIARVVNVIDVKVTADVSEAYITSLNRGDSVWVYYPTLDFDVKSKVLSAGQYIDPNNRTFDLTVEAANIENGLKPNMLAFVTFYDYIKEDAIVIPNKVIQYNGEQAYVYVSDSGVAKKKLITTEVTYDGWTVVKSGLTTEDTVVMEGYRNIQEGEAIEDKK